MTASPCTTHFHACDCREERVRHLLGCLDTYIAHRVAAKSLPTEGPEVNEWTSAAVIFWQNIVDARDKLND